MKMKNERQILRAQYKRVLLLFLCFPVFVSISVLFFGEDIAFCFSVVYGLVFLMMGVFVFNKDCPSCKMPFFRSGIFYSVLPACSHCGYNLFSKKSTGSEQ